MNSGDEFLISEDFRLTDTNERVSEQVRVLAVVVPPLQLVQVGREMLHRDVVVGPDDGALQEAPDALDGVGVDLPTDPLVLGVVDRVMPGVLVAKLGNCLVGGQFVGVDELHSVLDVRLDELSELGTVAGPADFDSGLTAPLNRSDNEGLVPGVAAAPTALLPSDERFVHFDGVIQEGAVVGHGGANTVGEIPSSFGGHSDSAGQLSSGHALLGLDDKERCEEPLPQGELGVLEDGSDSDGELVLASVALEQLAGVDPSDLGRLALRAGDTVGPAQFGERFDAPILSPVFFDQSCDVHTHNTTARM